MQVGEIYPAICMMSHSWKLRQARRYCIATSTSLSFARTRDNEIANDALDLSDAKDVVFMAQPLCWHGIEPLIQF